MDAWVVDTAGPMAGGPPTATTREQPRPLSVELPFHRRVTVPGTSRFRVGGDQDLCPAAELTGRAADRWFASLAVAEGTAA